MGRGTDFLNALDIPFSEFGGKVADCLDTIVPFDENDWIFDDDLGWGFERNDYLSPCLGLDYVTNADDLIRLGNAIKATGLYCKLSLEDGVLLMEFENKPVDSMKSSEISQQQKETA